MSIRLWMHYFTMSPLSLLFPPLYFFSITLLYISLNIMKLLNFIKVSQHVIHKLITCDYPKWLALRTTVTSLWTKIITNSLGIQKIIIANMVVGLDPVKILSSQNLCKISFGPHILRNVHQSVISMKFELIVYHGPNPSIVMISLSLCQLLLKFITKYEFIRL
jgi:hypothetical protein